MFSDFGALITNLYFAIYVHCWRIADRLSALVMALIWINFAWCPIVSLLGADGALYKKIVSCKLFPHSDDFNEQSHHKMQKSTREVETTWKAHLNRPWPHIRSGSIRNHYLLQEYRLDSIEVRQHNDTFSGSIACTLWEVIKKSPYLVNFNVTGRAKWKLKTSTLNVSNNYKWFVGMHSNVPPSSERWIWNISCWVRGFFDRIG